LRCREQFIAVKEKQRQKVRVGKALHGKKWREKKKTALTSTPKLHVSNVGALLTRKACKLVKLVKNETRRNF
jgi:hypothetical protein